MIIDKFTEFEDTKDFAALADETSAFADILDLVKGGDAEKAMWLVLHVNETFVGGTSVQLELQTDDDVAFGSPKQAVLSPAIVVADLVADFRPVFAVRVPYGTEQHLRARAIVVGTITSGKASCRLVNDATLNNLFNY